MASLRVLGLLFLLLAVAGCGEGIKSVPISPGAPPAAVDSAKAVLNELANTGELGSGKTTMIKGIVKYLTGKEATSPSFVLINEYPGEIPVFHFDLYRLRCKIDMENIGWEEYLDKGLVLIEWADRMKDILPANATLVNISIVNEKRKIVIRRGRK